MMSTSVAELLASAVTTDLVSHPSSHISTSYDRQAPITTNHTEAACLVGGASGNVMTASASRSLHVDERHATPSPPPPPPPPTRFTMSSSPPILGTLATAFRVESSPQPSLSQPRSPRCDATRGEVEITHVPTVDPCPSNGEHGSRSDKCKQPSIGSSPVLNALDTTPILLAVERNEVVMPMMSLGRSPSVQPHPTSGQHPPTTSPSRRSSGRRSKSTKDVTSDRSIWRLQWFYHW
jgi:hypothetical protein